MKYCPNVDCPHAEVVGSPAEYHDQVQICADCQTPLKWGEPPELETERPVPTAALVLVDQFRDVMLAQLIRSKLESEGITVFLRDEHMIQVNWLISNALDGIKLMVPEPEVERAREIIRDTLDTDPMKSAQSFGNQSEGESSQKHCLRCGSKDIYFTRGSMVMKILALILIFPLVFLKKRNKCNQCGHVWKFESGGDLSLEDTDAYKKTD